MRVIDEKMKVLLDTSPLDSGHARRGIGTYTRMLAEHLVGTSRVELVSEGKADVIHYPYFDLFYATLPLSLSTPVVVTIHDVIPLLFPEHFPVGIKGKLSFLKQKLALKAVSAVITVSESSKRDISKYLDVPEKKIYVVYSAANQRLTGQVSSLVKKVIKKYNLPKKYILYVGDINYNKNLPQLIKSLKFLPEDVNLVCVGQNFTPQDIPEWRQIEAQMAMSAVEDRVHFVTTLKSELVEDLAAVYSGAVAYIQPSLAEGFGLPVLEAMQCRTPVVCADNTSLPEVAGEHAVMVKTEAESIAEGVAQVLSWSQSKREKVIRQAYKWSQTFSWERTAVQTIEVYQNIIK
jgi:glycosyltransferase involved in cell wall biosynthesis